MTAQYKACIKAYLRPYADRPSGLGNLERVYEVGDTVELVGAPGATLEPMNDEAWDAVKAQADERKKKGQPPLHYLWRKEWPAEKPAVSGAPGWRKPKVEPTVEVED